MFTSIRKKVTIIALSIIVAIATFGAVLSLSDKTVIADGVPTPSATYTVANNYSSGALNATTMISDVPIENISVGSKVYIGYEVKKSAVTATQFGVLSSTDPNASGSDVWNGNGRLQFGSFNMYESGCKYLVEITVNASNTFTNTVTKTSSDSSQSTNSFTSVAGSGFSNTANNYFGIWASEGGIGDVILENVFICDEQGNDLGVRFDGGRNQYYAVIKNAECGTGYQFTQGADVPNTYMTTEKPYTGIGTKVIFEYTVDDITTNTINQSGVFTTTAPTAGWPYTANNGGNMWHRANGLCLEKGYTYKFIIERLESDIKIGAYRINISTGVYENLYYPSSAGQTASGDSGYFGIWLYGSISGLKVSNARVYDESGKSYGVRFNTSNISRVIPEIDYTGDTYTIKAVKGASQRICITSNTKRDDIGDVVTLKYYVAKSEGKTINQTGFVITNDPLREFTYQGGTMRFKAGCPILDEGFEYTIVYLRTSETDFSVTVKKDDLNGNVTNLDLSGFGLTNSLQPGEYGYFGLHLSEGGISQGTTLDNIRCYDQNGNDLGIVVNKVHMDTGNFTVTKDSENITYSVTDISGQEIVPSTNVKTYSTYTLPVLTSSYNCWTDGENFYDAGQKVRLSKDVDFTEVVKIVTYTGAGLKSNATKESSISQYGLRWSGGVNKFYFDSLVAKYGADNVSFSMIITTKDILGDDEFTLDNLEEGEYNLLTATSWSAILESEKNNGCYSFYASVKNIKEGNLNRVYIARTVLQYTDGNEDYEEYGNYSLADQGRSVYYLAKCVYEDITVEESKREFAKGIIDSVLVIEHDEDVTVVTPTGYESKFSVTYGAGVYTITAIGDGKISDLKLVVINGGNYRFVVDAGNTATVTLNK